MAEKRYFWLKLEKGFFDDKLIKKLRRMAGGDTYCIIYLRLILESMENDGALYFDGVEGTFAEELALTLDESVENVQALLSILVATNRVEQVTDEELKMLDFVTMTGSEASSTRRSRKCRDGQKALQCNTNATESNESATQSKSKSKSREDIELEKDKSNILNKFNNPLGQTILDWIDYKKEMKKAYKPKGLQSLLTQIENNVKNYGESNVANLIVECMSNQYQGIIWDKLKNQKQEFQERQYNDYNNIVDDIMGG